MMPTKAFSLNIDSLKNIIGDAQGVGDFYCQVVVVHLRLSEEVVEITGHWKEFDATRLKSLPISYECPFGCCNCRTGVIWCRRRLE